MALSYIQAVSVLVHWFGMGTSVLLPLNVLAVYACYLLMPEREGEITCYYLVATFNLQSQCVFD